MCRCTPEIRTPWCGKPGCEGPKIGHNAMIEPTHGQGVFSKITFPINEDIEAVNRAVYQLLKEGWSLERIDAKQIIVSRKWEA